MHNAVTASASAFVLYNTILYVFICRCRIHWHVFVNNLPIINEAMQSEKIDWMHKNGIPLDLNFVEQWSIMLRNILKCKSKEKLATPSK